MNSKNPTVTAPTSSGTATQGYTTLWGLTLQRDGIVTRTAYDVMPPRVDYELTALGQTLHEPLSALGRWAEEHVQEVMKARESYDDRLDSGL